MIVKAGIFCTLIFAVYSKFQWRDLTQQEIKEWYTPLDICTMESKSIKVFPQDFKAKNCTEWSKGSRRLHCGVGMGSNNYPCYGPFSTARPHFRRGIQGFTDAASKPLIEAFYRLIKSNTSIVFLGDSTMRQKVQALECELLREDKRIRAKGNLFGILPCDTELKILFPDGKSIDIHSVSMGPTAISCLKGGKHTAAPAGGVFENAAEIVRRINYDQNRNVMIIGNMGLWYNNMTEFEPVLPPTLDWLHSVATTKDRNNIVMWHETVSQHWVGPTGSGYFDVVHVDAQEAAWKDIDKVSIEEYNNPLCCHKITNVSYLADWRNDLVERYLSATGKIDQVRILPMAEITRPLVDMHTCNPLYMHDCTHYCYFPLVWQPLWHQMLQASQRVFPSTQ